MRNWTVLLCSQRTLKAVDLRGASCPANIKQGDTGAKYCIVVSARSHASLVLAVSLVKETSYERGAFGLFTCVSCASHAAGGFI